MGRLYKKAWSVVVAGQPDPTSFVARNSQFFETTGNAVEIDAMKVSFSVSKSLAKEPNKCTMTLTNLSDATRGVLDRTPVLVTLNAGYDGEARLLFTGDLRFSNTKMEGSDRVTSIEVRDGMRAFAHARVSRSYKPPIRVSQVLSDCAKSMGLSLPPEIEQSTEMKQALADGINTHGVTRDVLTRLLAPYGYSWSIQSGSLIILADGQARKGEALLVNEDMGLIGSPERAAPSKPGAKSPLSFECLLYPELAPGMLVKVESEFVDGVFRIKECTHTGDSHSGDWKTSVRAEPS